MVGEYYFVVSDGDRPLQICFNIEEAKAYSQLLHAQSFIDSFSEDGNYVATYKYNVDACEYIELKE